MPIDMTLLETLRLNRKTPRCHMTAHTLRQEWRRRPARRESRNGVVQLGWSQFWLLIGILGGLLALVVLVFVSHLASL
jgi:hypothetical protein